MRFFTMQIYSIQHQKLIYDGVFWLLNLVLTFTSVQSSRLWILYIIDRARLDSKEAPHRRSAVYNLPSTRFPTTFDPRDLRIKLDSDGKSYSKSMPIKSVK